MDRSHRRTCVASALLPLFLSLDVAAALGADPARPVSPVPIQPYGSVFQNYRPAVDETTSPDKLWRGANESVAEQGGHGGMAGMSMDGSPPMPVPASGEKPPQPNLKMPMDHKMPMPADHATPMDNAMPMPKKVPRETPAPASPMPAGMDMHEGHKGK